MDSCDVDRFSAFHYKWSYKMSGARRGNKHYVTAMACIPGTKGKKLKTVYFHRLILNAEPGDVIDHMDGDTLNNQRNNLRIVTSMQNTRNQKKRIPELATSQFKGIHRVRNKWRAAIRDEGRNIHLGYFVSQFEAALSYDIASIKRHGEFGWRNFLPFVR